MPKPPRKRVPEFVKDAIIEQAVKGKVKDPDLGKLVTHFFDICGGERAVATLLYGEWVQANSGSLVRQRILEMLFRCLSKLEDKRAPEDDLGVLSEEDIEREILELSDELSDDAEVPGPEAEADQQDGAEGGTASAPGPAAGPDPGAEVAGGPPDRLGGQKGPDDPRPGQAAPQASGGAGEAPR